MSKTFFDMMKRILVVHTSENRNADLKALAKHRGGQDPAFPLGIFNDGHKPSISQTLFMFFIHNLCKSMHVEVREQLLGVLFYFHPVGPRDWTLVTRLDGLLNKMSFWPCSEEALAGLKPQAFKWHTALRTTHCQFKGCGSLVLASQFTYGSFSLVHTRQSTLLSHQPHYCHVSMYQPVHHTLLVTFPNPVSSLWLILHVKGARGRRNVCLVTQLKRFTWGSTRSPKSSAT